MNAFSSPDQGFQTEAVVKWFNLTKGFGFVAPVDGSSDAFMHSSVVNRAGLRDIAEGTKLLVQITDGPKGRQVASIMQVMGVAEIPMTGRPAPSGPEVDMTGTVKWFKHRTVAQRAGVQMLESGQKVRMKVQTSTKGREATSVEIIN
jgi:cold shock protein